VHLTGEAFKAEPQALRAAIEAACRALPLRQGDDVDDDVDVAIKWAVDVLCLLAATAAKSRNGKRVARQFEGTSRATTLKELRDVEAVAARLLLKIEGLHAPAIIALADWGALRDPLRGQLGRLVRAARAARADSDLPDQPKPGRKVALFPQSVARLAYTVFVRLTGAKPARSYSGIDGKCIGPFPTFVAAIFAELKVGASVDHYVRATLDWRATLEALVEKKGD
jgi:hypothetical protein